MHRSEDFAVTDPMDKTCECCGGPFEYRITSILGMTHHNLCKQHAQERVKADRSAVLSVRSPRFAVSLWDLVPAA